MNLPPRWPSVLALALAVAACGPGSPTGGGGGGSGGTSKLSTYDLLVVSAQGDLCGVDADGTHMTVLKQAETYDANDDFQQLDVSPDGTRVVYRASCGGVPFLRIMGSDLKAPTDLTPSCQTQSASWPAFSRDGKQIVFVACDWSASETGCYLHLMSADGTNDHRLTPLDPSGADPKDASPTFSPDGQQVVFVSNRQGCMQVFSIGVDGTGMAALAPSGCTNAAPVPFTVAIDAPRGLLYEDLAQVGVLGGKQNVYEAAYPSGAPTLVTNESQHSLQRPAISPDGTLLAYDRDSGSFGFGTLEVLDLASGRTTAIPGTGYFGFDQYPVFVPRP